MPNAIDVIRQQGVMVSHDIEQLEKEMLDMPQVDCPVIHRFGPGLYIREVTLPAGSFAIGHYQKRDHLNIMLKGSVTMVREDGSTELLTAPLMYVGKPGRKMGFIHEEVVWQNIYATDEIDIEKLEEMFLDKSEYSVEFARKSLAESYTGVEADREDYHLALKELGVSHEQAWRESTIDNVMSFPHGSYKFRVAESPIHGKGLFATADIAANEFIAPARLRGNDCMWRTPAGRYTNHSATPNAKMVLLPNGDVTMISIRDIKGSRGGMLGDEITIDYRQAYRETRGEPSCLP